MGTIASILFLEQVELQNNLLGLHLEKLSIEGLEIERIHRVWKKRKLNEKETLSM